MDISFNYDCYFLLKELKSDENKKALFGLFIVISIFSGILQFFLQSRNKLIRKSSLLTPIILNKSLFFAISTINMLLIMTCNGWIIISTMVGLFIGYFLFVSKYR